jgi:transposase
LDGRARCDSGQVFEALPETVMWTPTTRAQHSRTGLRYGSDVTDAEWRILSPFLPAARLCGCPRKWEMREIVNAIFYVLRGGVAWSLLPKDFPPWPTAYRWFARFRDDGTWERINHHLVMLDRERSGREASPTAAVIDSQSAKTTESGGVRGYDAGKKIKVASVTPCRYRRSGAEVASPLGSRSGPGRRRAAVASLARELAVRGAGLRGRRICWPACR